MSHRAHLFSLRIFHAIREVFNESSYSMPFFFKDLLAGITVGIIAIPLAMALAIAVGVAPQYGLYTAIIAGFIIPLTGGSRYSVSGPTAAFVVILYPIVQQYGLAGLLIASTLSGVILVIMALLRFGRFIEYIPEAVTLGFTGGIAIVIATLQIKDFFGLTLTKLPESYIEKVNVLFSALPQLSTASTIVAVTTLVIMLIWPRLKTPIPAHLPAVIIGALLAFYLNQQGENIATIGSTFHYLLSDGSTGNGIPALLPDFQWPWQRNQLGETPLVFDWSMAKDMLSAAFAIAMLGAIESLLCAVVLDGMSGKKHSANSELMGQGIGNIITPFLGGITATAAIARSAANFKAGAVSPFSAMIHAFVVLLSLVSLTSLLAYLPMASMAALLLIVAWNMSEAPKALHLIKNAPRSEMFVFLTCLSLTVIFDMVIAIVAGIVLASLLFMKQIADMTKIHDMTHSRRLNRYVIPDDWKVFKINGPLFFAAADKVFGELSLFSDNLKGVIIYLDGVSILDSGGVSALTKYIEKCKKTGTRVYLADFQFQPLKTLAKAKFKPDGVHTKTFASLYDALASLSPDKD